MTYNNARDTKLNESDERLDEGGRFNELNRESYRRHYPRERNGGMRYRRSAKQRTQSPFLVVSPFSYSRLHLVRIDCRYCG